MDTSSFLYERDTEDFYKDIDKDIERRFATTEYPMDVRHDER